MRPRSGEHWTWRLYRWCTAWNRSHWWYSGFKRLRLELLWSQLDPFGYGILTYHNGDELIWLWPSKRAKFNCGGSDAVWYDVNLAHGYKSLKEIDKFWEEYSAAIRAAQQREEASREDFYF